MKAILKAGSLLALIAIIGSSSCSVERKTRHGKKNLIDVGMNQKQMKNSQAVTSSMHSGVIAVAAK